MTSTEDLNPLNKHVKLILCCIYWEEFFTQTQRAKTGPKLWNRLSEPIHHSDTLQKFMSAMKPELFTEAYGAITVKIFTCDIPGYLKNCMETR